MDLDAVVGEDSRGFPPTVGTGWIDINPKTLEGKWGMHFEGHWENGDSALLNLGGTATFVTGDDPKLMLRIYLFKYLVTFAGGGTRTITYPQIGTTFSINLFPANFGNAPGTNCGLIWCRVPVVRIP